MPLIDLQSARTADARIDAANISEAHAGIEESGPPDRKCRFAAGRILVRACSVVALSKGRESIGERVNYLREVDRRLVEPRRVLVLPAAR